MAAFELTDMQKIGIGLSSIGSLLLFLGIIMFFDRGLLAIGNILFIAGITCVIGIQRTLKFFFQMRKIKATTSFFSGILILLLGWPLIGMIVECYGFVMLFSGFLPIGISFLRRIPILSFVFHLPGINKVTRKIGEPDGLV
ncbi:Golgi transport protein 1 [Intoshia linei]|uniref:Golgi transport protein 1 n=1 Tax=Intoshia linei TaxID=1819745 RepID=A0A177B2C9_9BILA|nr:Golgi transport protein 1 [Intoshia linei]